MSVYRCIHCCDPLYNAAGTELWECRSFRGELTPSLNEYFAFCAIYYMVDSNKTRWDGQFLSTGNHVEKKYVKQLETRCQRRLKKKQH